MKWRWLAYAAVATPLLVLVGIGWMMYGTFGQHPVRDLTRVTKWTRVQFPAGTKIIDGVAQGATPFCVIAKGQSHRLKCRSF
jgi:hypothetical protein